MEEGGGRQMASRTPIQFSASPVGQLQAHQAPRALNSPHAYGTRKGGGRVGGEGDSSASSSACDEPMMDVGRFLQNTRRVSVMRGENGGIGLRFVCEAKGVVVAGMCRNRRQLFILKELLPA